MESCCRRHQTKDRHHDLKGGMESADGENAVIRLLIEPNRPPCAHDLASDERRYHTVARRRSPVNGVLLRAERGGAQSSFLLYMKPLLPGRSDELGPRTRIGWGILSSRPPRSAWLREERASRSLARGKRPARPRSCSPREAGSMHRWPRSSHQARAPCGIRSEEYRRRPRPEAVVSRLRA